MKDLSSAFQQQPPHGPGPIDPIELFRALKIKSGSSIKELWAPQSDALKDWHANRQSNDVLIQLNTGAGKTLIGLVAAQSLVNETRGRIVYCCATRQLVDQTREKAVELGLTAATYHSGQWLDQEGYQKGETPLITTYAALLNGRSIFRSENIQGLILDDAHTAHDAVRSAFTLSIDRREFDKLYNELTGRVEDYFESIDREFVFDAVRESRDPSTVLMVPMFEALRHVDDFRSMLLKAGVEDSKNLVFPWTHIAPRLDCCVLLFDHQRIEFTPLLPPIHQIPSFRDGIRRVYLSATLEVNPEFIRSFGRVPETVIVPGGRAGEGERLMLRPPKGSNEEEARRWAEEATRGLKAAIMVPTWQATDNWKESADIFAREDGHDRVQQFASSTDERLVFVARYDGIDLPDDSCRAMVVDGLPSGLGLLDRFFEQHLERVGISSSKIASRFLQLLGRTSRGMSDYGVVLLTGARLLNWILSPNNRALLPSLVQRQFALGERLGELKNFTTRELVDACLSQTAQWSDVYQRGIREGQVEERVSLVVNRDLELARAERDAADAYWGGNYEKGVRILTSVLEGAFAAERTMGAWFLHWTGFGYQSLGDMEAAKRCYNDAAAVKRDLGRIPEVVRPQASDINARSHQSSAMAAILQDRGIKRVLQDLENFASLLQDKDESAGRHEEAIRLLGEYLAFRSTRPEKETAGKGPDNLWVTPDQALLMFFDAKTKMDSASYSKKRIGESAQHSLWVAERFPKAERFHFLVGPRVPATPQATPPRGLRVVEPVELCRVAGDVKNAYTRAADRNLPLFYAAEIEIALKDSGLEWESLPESLETIRLDAL